MKKRQVIDENPLFKVVAGGPNKYLLGYFVGSFLTIAGLSIIQDSIGGGLLFLTLGLLILIHYTTSSIILYPTKIVEKNIVRTVHETPLNMIVDLGEMRYKKGLMAKNPSVIYSVALVLADGTTHKLKTGLMKVKQVMELITILQQMLQQRQAQMNSAINSNEEV